MSKKFRIALYIFAIITFVLLMMMSWVWLPTTPAFIKVWLMIVLFCIMALLMMLISTMKED